jgi:hypothetical protein
VRSIAKHLLGLAGLAVFGVTAFPAALLVWSAGVFEWRREEWNIAVDRAHVSFTPESRRSVGSGARSG